MKGSIFCDDCDSRLTLDFASGNGGRYCYFVCLGRKRRVVCLQKAMQTEAVEQALLRHWRTVRIPEERKAEIRRLLAEDLDEARAEAETDHRVQERRVQKLKDERQKLLDGYYAGAIPLDMLKTEQDRIGRGLAAAEERLGRLTGQFDRIEEVITRAMVWVDSLHEAYQAATEQVRRLLNQALYTRMFVGQDGVVRVIYTEGFGWLLGEEEQDEVSAGAADREEVVTGRDDVPVEAEVVVRFERTARHNDKRPGWKAGAHARGSVDHGWNVKRLVEVSGLFQGFETGGVREVRIRSYTVGPGRSAQLVALGLEIDREALEAPEVVEIDFEGDRLRRESTSKGMVRLWPRLKLSWSWQPSTTSCWLGGARHTDLHRSHPGARGMLEQLAQRGGIALIDPVNEIGPFVDPRFDVVGVAIGLIHDSQGTRTPKGERRVTSP